MTTANRTTISSSNARIVDNQTMMEIQFFQRDDFKITTSFISFLLAAVTSYSNSKHFNFLLIEIQMYAYSICRCLYSWNFDTYRCKVHNSRIEIICFQSKPRCSSRYKTDVLFHLYL